MIPHKIPYAHPKKPTTILGLYDHPIRPPADVPEQTPVLRQTAPYDVPVAPVMENHPSGLRKSPSNKKRSLLGWLSRRV